MILNSNFKDSKDISYLSLLQEEVEPYKIKDFLHSKGIKASYPRTRIYEHISALSDYPTATMVYNDLTSAIPSLSKATVYNTLNLFVEKNIIRAINIESKETRYTIRNTQNNTNFKCKECNKLIDFFFNMDEEISKLPSMMGCDIHNLQVNLKGVCEECAKKDLEERT